MNQIYWRIVANNAIVNEKPEGEHSWIRDKEYEESIIKIIGKAIGDCVTKQNEFANPTKDGLIVFEVSPEDYEPEHWNAVMLYNYIKAKRDEVYKKYTGYIRPSYEAINFNDLQKKLYDHYEKGYRNKKALSEFIGRAREDIEKYKEALGLEKVLEEFFSTAKEYDEPDKIKRERRERLDKLKLICQNYKYAYDFMDWIDKGLFKDNDLTTQIAGIYLQEKTQALKSAIEKKENVWKELDQISRIYNSTIDDTKNGKTDVIDKLISVEINEWEKKSGDLLKTLTCSDAARRYCDFESSKGSKIKKYYAAADCYCFGITNLIHKTVAPGLFAILKEGDYILRYNVKLTNPSFKGPAPRNNALKFSPLFEIKSKELSINSVSFDNVMNSYGNYTIKGVKINGIISTSGTEDTEDLQAYLERDKFLINLLGDLLSESQRLKFYERKSNL